MSRFSNITRDKKVLYILSAVLFAVLLPLLFISKSVGRPITAVLLVLSAVSVSLIIKKRSILSINKNTVALLLAVIGILYVVIYYLTGLSFGFYNNPYAISFLSSLGYIVPIAVSIIAMEIIRRIVLAQKNILATVLMTFAAITVDILLSNSSVTAETFNGFMDLVGLTLFPAVTANLLYNYLSARYGALPNVLYRLTVTLYVYVIPYVSAVSDSITAFVSLVLPPVILGFIDMLYEKKVRYATRRPSKLRYVGGATTVLLMISIVMLISCQFKFGMLVIGSDSMTGEINKGDAVVYERLDGERPEVGEVVVFNKDGAKIVHRVVKIEHINNQTRYYTKGDANEEPDGGYITEADIVGITSFKIAYIGYPTLWMRDVFAKLS